MQVDYQVLRQEPELREHLEEAIRRALRQPEVLKQAEDLGIADGLKSQLDIEDDALWRPCRAELATLMRLRNETQQYEKALRRRLSALWLLRPAREQDKRLRGPGAHSDKSPARRQQQHKSEIDELELAFKQAVGEDARHQLLVKQAREIQANLTNTFLTRSVLPKLRSWVNEQVRIHRDEAVRFTQALEPLVRPGLQDAPKRQSVLATSLEREYSRLIDPRKTSRAAIGITGPPGAGKSRILDSTFDGWLEGIRIRLSSPASYDPKEFLLHLYGQTCQRILSNDEDARLRGASGGYAPARRDAMCVLYLLALPALGLLCGLILIVTSATRDSTPDEHELKGIGGAIIVASLVPLIFRLGLFSFKKVSKAYVSTVVAGMPVFRGWPKKRLAAATIVTGGLLIAGALSEVDWLSLRKSIGMALVSSAIITALPGPRVAHRVADLDLERSPADRLVIAARSWVARITVGAVRLSAAIAGLVLILVPASVAALPARLVVGVVVAAAAATALDWGLRWRDLLLRADVVEEPEDEDDIREKAEKALMRMRYQRTTMSGTTTTAKVAASSWLPFGFDAGSTRSTTEAEAPLTVPDIVDGIKDLLAGRGPSLIIIDGLDKVQSPDMVRNLLGEIKSVFDAENSHFVVAVPEDLKEAYVNAFTEVVRVPYLTAAQARQLLNERVAGMQPQFVALAYCQSGGLPRDLLRSADQMIDLATDLKERGRTPYIELIAHDVLHRDLRLKIESVRVAMRSVPVEPDVSRVLRFLQGLDSCGVDGQRASPCLLDQNWLKGLDTLDPLTPADSRDHERRALLRLTADTLGYVYFCRTMLELFQTHDEFSLKRLIRFVNEADGKLLDDLVQARRSFAVNPWVAWDQVTQIRDEGEMEPFNPPPPLIPPVRAIDLVGASEGSTASRPE